MAGSYIYDDFPFDEMRVLNESDPEAFERRRQELIEREMASFGPDASVRMRRFQWRIDVMARGRSPTGAMVQFHRLMLERLNRLHEVATYGIDGLEDADILVLPGNGVAQAVLNE